MRTPPELPPAPTVRRKQTGEERKYQFLTYVFGGGVKVRDHEKYRDTVTPVRAASIRGQLRFWWRACNPSRCQTLEELRRREGEIWGTTSQASKVEIAVLSQPFPPRDVQVFEYNEKRRLVSCRGMKEIAYGAFPLQPSRDAQTATKAPAGVLFDYGSSSFSLRFTYPEELRADVEAALWAWETFGGLGGRTRRGFGAVTRADLKEHPPADSKLSTYKENPLIDGVPSLHGSRFAVTRLSSATALEAWKEGLGLLQKIRQGRDFGRNEPPKNSMKPAGRSRWPEPDEIRQLTGQSAPAHRQPVVEVPRFPRAAFGMPIVFHFHPGSQDEPGSAGDPGMKPLQLQPVGFERFASPLIIRPVKVGTSFHTAALALSSALPPVELRAGESVFSVDWELEEPMARRISPLNRNGVVYTDPTDLFLSELKK